MSETATESVDAVARGGASATRARILKAATELFYANGIRGTSADRIIEQVGITKVTFYRHFRAKTDLVVAYLESQAAGEREMMTRARDDRDALEALRSIAGTIGAESCLPGFRGCPFINAAAETPDPHDPVRVVIDQHRTWTRDMFAGIAADAGVSNPQATAGQLMMLRDGAMVNGYLGDPDQVADTLRAAYAAVIASALRQQR